MYEIYCLFGMIRPLFMVNQHLFFYKIPIRLLISASQQEKENIVSL